jgi:hypothetical protein
VRVPFGALAEADLPPAKRCPPVVIGQISVKIQKRKILTDCLHFIASLRSYSQRLLFRVPK